MRLLKRLLRGFIKTGLGRRQLRIQRQAYVQGAVVDTSDHRGPGAAPKRFLLPGLDSPYLIIQRQFETPDDGRCYIETHDHLYVGHYRLKLTGFGPTQLVVAIERNSNTHV